VRGRLRRPGPRKPRGRIHRLPGSPFRSARTTGGFGHEQTWDPRIALPVAPRSIAASRGAARGASRARELFLGSKVLDEKDWAPRDTHTEAGVEASWGGESWPVPLATDLLGSTRSKQVLGVDSKATTGELGLGVRKIWNTGSSRRVHPYIGGGVSFIAAKFEAGSTSDKDNGVGRVARGRHILAPRLALQSWDVAPGLVGERGSYGIRADAGGGHFGLCLGWGWPAAER